MQAAADIDALWEYGDPAASEERFRAALGSAAGDQRLELLTQIARTHSLRRRFAEAHGLLDEIEPLLAGAGPRPRARYLLERGRTFNSAGDPEAARRLFAEAWELAGAADAVGLAVDAAHMLAITHANTPAAIEWNGRGLELARPSADPKARALIPAMLNNAAWDLHGLGRYAEALDLFAEAEAEWRARGRQPQIRIARWSVARCLRSLGRHGEALAIQRELEAEHRAAGSADGYVFEEIAENLDAQGERDLARPYFAQAAAELGRDAWFAEHEAARLAALRERAGNAATV
ncbi:MAG TPA: tetratricopeptide repeat protein [Herpetosiphonaceae bacterium]|nr:tetratricopeptide repeat protein [Herpetosiphonaceae bacterium]